MRQLIIVVGLLVVTFFVFARHAEASSGERFRNELTNEDEVDNSARQVNWKKALPMMKKGNFRGNQGYYGGRNRYAGRSAWFDSDEDQNSDRRR